jgi:NMD protein affecting ribosome stability and mRNA decay
MALPKCANCGARLTSLSEINGYGGYCSDCYKKGQQWANIPRLIIVGVVIFILIRLFM